MKKKTYIIIIILCIVILASLIVLLVNKNNNNSVPNISKELQAARETFDIELNSSKDEYIIYGLKKAANYDGNKIIIPDSVDNIPITKLVDKNLKNFSSYNNIVSITLGKNIAYIGTTVAKVEGELRYGENIFSGATKLANIYVSEANEVFSSVNGVLYNKEKTILIKYPAGKTSSINDANHTFSILNDVEQIYQKAFYQNQSIETIYLGEELRMISKEAFYGCINLTLIKFNEKLQTISNGAFANCTMLDGITLPNKVTAISYHTFYNCQHLTTIYIPNSVDTINSNSFVGCTSLSKIYTSSDNVNNLINILNNNKLDNLSKIVSYK